MARELIGNATLKEVYTHHQINIGKNNISEEGAKSIANMLRDNKTLKKLCIHITQGYMTTASETQAHSTLQLRSKRIPHSPQSVVILVRCVFQPNRRQRSNSTGRDAQSEYHTHHSQL